MNHLTATLGLAALLVAGCGGPSLQAPADPARARAALCAALDAWQRGDTLDSLKGSMPAVQVSDQDWSAGYRLTRYQLAPDGTRVGIDLRYQVTLTLRDVQGKTGHRNTAYVVATSPVLTVVRHDPGS
jgi:hypothetical protein